MNLSPRPRARQHGMAVIVVIALLSILLIYLTGNARTLHNLARELSLLEVRQVHRLSLEVRTNAPPNHTLTATNRPAT